MKKENDLANLGLTILGVVVVGGVICNAAGAVIGVGYNIMNKINYKRKIKNGLKDGSIVEIDGQYYGVEINKEDVEEA